MRVIHATHQGDAAFLARSFETGEEAVIITQGTKDSDRIADYFGERKVVGTA